MINKDEKFELTKEGKLKLEEELYNLENVDRIRILEAIKEAREQGDLSENADYSSAKEQQAVIEARIAEIKNILKNAIILDVTRVTVKYLDLNKTLTYEIVGTIEADPFAGKISNDSPLGKAVENHKVNDIFFITTESGKELRLQLISTTKI